MSKSGRSLLGLAVAVSLIAVACSDASRPLATAPDRAAAPLATESTNLLGTLTSLLIAPVHRKKALEKDVVWSFTAGPSGATSKNKTVGLTVAIPRNALTSTVKITVTALQGTAVSYRFEPHLEFKKPVTLTQSLKGLDVGLATTLVLKGAHFPGDSPEYTSDGLALVDEVVSGLLNLLANTFTFSVQHFTGWIVASGNERSHDSY